MDEEDYEFLIFDENYDYNTDDYKYGDIDGKRIRVSVDDWMDIWSWRTYKTKEDNWFKMTPYLHTDWSGYKKYIVNINGVSHVMSRVLYKLYNRNWDITDNSNMNEIDHQNQNSLDNRIENLRVLTRRQNSCNMTFRGTRQRPNGKWQARLQYNGINKAKDFDTESEAHQQYLIWKKEFHILPE